MLPIGYNMIMLRKFLLLIILLLTGLIPTACGTQEKRPSQDVLLAKDAFGHLERLRQAYSARDMAALEHLCSQSAYTALRQEMKEFKSVSLEFQNKWVDIKSDGTLEVQVAWMGEWFTGGENGSLISDSGRATFVLSGRALKLMGVHGSDPFAGPSGTDTP